jgi:hypothetical protein
MLCTALTKLENTGAITYLGEGAMQHCWAITTLNFPALTTIDSYGVADCLALTTFNAPLVTSIGPFSFGFGNRGRMLRPTFPLLPNPPESAFAQFY